MNERMNILFSCLVIYMTHPSWDYSDTLTNTNQMFRHVNHHRTAQFLNIDQTNINLLQITLQEKQQAHKHSPPSTRHNTQLQTQPHLHPSGPDPVYLIQFINQYSVNIKMYLSYVPVLLLSRALERYSENAKILSKRYSIKAPFSIPIKSKTGT